MNWREMDEHERWTALCAEMQRIAGDSDTVSIRTFNAQRRHGFPASMALRTRYGVNWAELVAACGCRHPLAPECACGQPVVTGRVSFVGYAGTIHTSYTKRPVLMALCTDCATMEDDMATRKVAFDEPRTAYGYGRYFA